MASESADGAAAWGAWTNVAGGSFTNGWTSPASGTYPVSYRTDGDTVELRGELLAGSLGLSAFTLPAGFRPQGDVIAPAGCTISKAASEACSVTISTTGTVTPNTAQAGVVSVWLGSISFSILP